MSDSKREQIIQAVVAALDAITPANGYDVDFSGRVHSWRLRIGQDEFPAVIVRDLIDDIQAPPQQVVKAHLHTLTVQVDILANGDTPARLARQYLAEVSKAIGANLNWGGLAIRTTPLSEAMDVEQREDNAFAAILRFQIQFRTSGFDSY